MTEHLTSATITTALVSSIYGLVKVIQYFLTKSSAPPKEEVADNGHPMPRQQAEEIHTMFLYLTEAKVQQEYLRADIRSIKEGQDALSLRISELISSQQRVVDRMGDLIEKLDHIRFTKVED